MTIHGFIGWMRSRASGVPWSFVRTRSSVCGDTAWLSVRPSRYIPFASRDGPSAVGSASAMSISSTSERDAVKARSKPGASG